MQRLEQRLKAKHVGISGHEEESGWAWGAAPAAPQAHRRAEPAVGLDP
jgi:hypothetical protein